MAAALPSLISPPLLSHKQRRAASRKERRKRKRQAVAQARELALNNGDVAHASEEETDNEDSPVAEEERRRLHEEWLERERLAQEEFQLRFEREEAARKRQEDEERMIKEEWEAQQRREEEEKEKRQQEKRGREEAVQKMLDEAENQLDHKGPWMNPEAPATEKSENYGTERDVSNCPFFLKTGACRFGDRCSRKHVYPASSSTLMVRGMFITFGMEEAQRDDYDMDACLEHSEEDLQESFLEFYHDVLPEFKSVGKVVQFKVSCNYEPHLRGNVYIQFDTEEQCREAFLKFNGRWYAGKQLHCEICPVTRWKNAICGLFDRQRCPKGKHCNFLHVFRNPGNEFWEADRDLHMSPDRSVRRGHRDGWHSERYGDRQRRQRYSSRSPPRSERSHGRREDERRRSRERRTPRDQRDDRRTFRSAHGDKGRDGHSGDWSRSRSRDRERDRRRNRSRDRDHKHDNRNRSEERDSDGDTRDRPREGERNQRSREKSWEKSERGEEAPDQEDSKRGRRHKHSKKSKKKSKKKRKRKHHSPDGTPSSGESDGEAAAAAAGEEEETGEAKPHQENDRTDGGESGDGDRSCSPTGKSESNGDVQTELPGEGDVQAS